MSYTRVGALYPFVDQKGAHGLLVGVASGGRIRVPSGDILWRIDEQPSARSGPPTIRKVSARPPRRNMMRQPSSLSTSR